MTAFSEGEEVEVCADIKWRARGRKAKIVCRLGFLLGEPTNAYEVQFRDGTRDVFDAEHIRGVSS